jgi:hypothetical protein
MPLHRPGTDPQQVKRDPLKNGFHTGTRVYDTFDCTWVCTYDLWYHAIVKHTAKRDFTTEHVATFETLEDWEVNFKADGTVGRKKPVFCMLMEPYNRWLEGLRYWLTEWTLTKEDRKIWNLKETSPLYFEKFNWPRMGNHTKTITECLSGIKIDGYLVADMNMDKKFIDFVKHYNLRFPWDFKITDYHQLIYDPVGMDQYRKEMNQYAQWLNEHHKFRDKVIQDYLKEDYNLWYKHKRF